MNTEVLVTALSSSSYRAFERIASIELKSDPNIKGIIPADILRIKPKPLQHGPNSTDKVVPKPLGDLGQNGTTKSLWVHTARHRQINHNLVLLAK